MRQLLRRGLWLTVANWPVVAMQWLAEAVFQACLALPVFGVAVVGAMVFAGRLPELLSGDTRALLAMLVTALLNQPVALTVFAVAFGLALVAGSTLLIAVKAGSLSVLVQADAVGASWTPRAWRTATLRQLRTFSFPIFWTGTRLRFRRFLQLAAWLSLAYALVGALYVVGIVVGYRWVDEGRWHDIWTRAVAASTVLLFLAITAVNVFYLLMQIALANEPIGLRVALRQVRGFVRARAGVLTALFLAVSFGLALAWVASAVLWTGVGLVAVLPVVGIAMVPLQLVGWVVRGVVFEFITVVAMSVYVSLYRDFHGRTLSPHHDEAPASRP